MVGQGLVSVVQQAESVGKKVEVNRNIGRTVAEGPAVSPAVGK